MTSYNLYSYCGGDPINNTDKTGHSPKGFIVQLFASVYSYAYMAVASNFDEDIRSDMDAIGWNPFNANEDIVLASRKVSFYKGVPVFQVSGMGGSMSFGIILFDKEQGVEVLKHERGHNTQLMCMGISDYLIQISIPSMWKNDDDTPWELSASMLGESALANGYSQQQKKQAYNYFIRSTIPIVNCYNILQYVFY